MARQPRIDLKDQIYHVIIRANARLQIFNTSEDYELFERTLSEAIEKFDMRIYTFNNMPNHVHLSASPRFDRDLSKFMHWLTMTFTQRYHKIHRTTGSGHLFQGRYKAFIVKDDRYLLQLFLYIERNALTAHIVKRAEDWRWSSLWIRLHGTKKQKKMLVEWPMDMPKDYLKVINNDSTDIDPNIWQPTFQIGRPKKSRKDEKGS